MDQPHIRFSTALKNDDATPCAGAASCTGSVWRFTHHGVDRELPLDPAALAHLPLRIAVTNGLPTSDVFYFRNNGTMHLVDSVATESFPLCQVACPEWGGNGTM